MEKMNDGTLSKKLEELFEFAKHMECELSLIDGDTVLNRRIEAIKEYPCMISQYQSQYQEISEQLVLYADGVNLIDFIVEWAIYDPNILIGLAERLNLLQRWSRILGRMPKMIQVER